MTKIHIRLPDGAVYKTDSPGGICVFCSERVSAQEYRDSHYGGACQDDSVTKGRGRSRGKVNKTSAETKALWKGALSGFAPPEPTEAEKFEAMAKSFEADKEMARYYRERAAKARKQLGEARK